MKKFRKMSIVAVVLVALGSMSVTAQQMGPLPVDPAVRTGQLDNGLTYYIRHNELPAGQAEFYIAQRVGSMQEEESQRGLAHFLEHMAFNGTTHFPGKTMLEYLESVGAKFGANINAYTSFDQTVYTLMNIPTARKGVVDTAMLVLNDWAHGISLEGKEIDSERGVIHEEWRVSQSAQMRIFDQVLPVIFEGSRYGHRLPIGLMSVVDNFTHKEIRDYYAKWYRPDLQGIIVVGDIDVDYIEAKIKDLFGHVTLAADRAERVEHAVPDNDAPIVAFARDKEMPYVQTMISYKHDPMPREMRATPMFLVQSFIQSMIGAMADARFNELTQKADPAFLGAAMMDMKMLGVTNTKDALTGIVITDEKGIERGVSALATEMRRIAQHGFTAAEYERAKADYLTKLETSYNECDKTRSATYANEYVRAFTDAEPIPGIEVEYMLSNQIVPAIQLDAINGAVKKLIGEKNIVIMMQGPDKEGVTYPTKEELLAIFGAASSADTEAWAEEVSNEPLVSVMPKKGKIKKVTRDEAFDATVWTLSNGARVVVKPTHHKDDEILMEAVSAGGTSLIASTADAEVRFLDEVGELGGLGSFSATDLPKVLAGKKASVSTSVTELSESVTANSAPRDLETMMQLVWLNFTSPRTDAEAFASWRSRSEAALRNMNTNPMWVYSDSLKQTLYAHNARMRQPRTEDIAAVDYAKALELYKGRFADAGDFTFIFVGNVDEATLRPLVEQYIASLPSAKKREKAGTPIAKVRGAVTNYFERTVEQPMVILSVTATDQMTPTLANSVAIDAVKQVLDSRYTETLRENEGGTYSPQVSGTLSPVSGQATVQVAIVTNAEKYQRLGEIIAAEAEKLTTEGTTDVELVKVREYMLKTDLQKRQENSFWMGSLVNYYRNGLDYQTGYADAVKALSRESIRDFAGRLFGAGNVVNVTMNGVAAQ